jgi:replicative DNA helicase Mcm
MNEGDRSSMHEAMEQQTISISKAGINASLRTRCAVLAAANPKNGRFEPISEVPYTAQINLAPPLVSRFDIIWLLTDDPDSEKDAMIAQHIISNRLQGISELLVSEGSAPDPTKSTSRSGIEQTPEHGEILSRDLIRKYIAYSKRTVHPHLEQKARDIIVKFYVETRKQTGDSNDSVAITARSLEALARLAEASARIRLSQVATLEDAERAVRMTRLWREDLMGGNFDETTLFTGKKGTVRNREKAIMEIVASLSANNGGVAQILDVFNEAERYDIDRSTAEDVIEKLCQHGRMLRPSGYDTLQIA